MPRDHSRAWDIHDEARIGARGGAVVWKVWSLLEAEGFFVPMPR